MCSLEKLKAMRTLEEDLPQNIFSNLLKKQNITYENYKKRMGGIDREDEFVIVLKALGIVKDLKKPDESYGKMFDMHTTDYKVELNNGKKILVEVKSISTDKKLKFTKKYIDGLSECGNLENTEIILVVCIKGFWMAFDLDYIKQNDNKLTLEDYENSILFKIFGLKAYVFLKGIEILSVYDKKHSGSICHDKYGGLISQTFNFNGQRLFKYNNKDNFIDVICIEEINNRLDDEKIKIDANFTTIIRTLKPDEDYMVIQEIDFILSQIYHTVDENKKYINISDEIRYNNRKNPEVHYFNLDVIRNVIRKLGREGLQYYCLADSCLYKDL